MKCTNDGSEMEKGVLYEDGHRFFSWDGFMATFATWEIIGDLVYAWRCRKCGKVEFTTDIPTKDRLKGLRECPKCQRNYSKSTEICPHCKVKTTII